MRQQVPKRLEEGRLTHAYSPYSTTRADGMMGCFQVQLATGVTANVMSSPGTAEVPWEHVSVTLLDANLRGLGRCPTWEEMCEIKELFFEPHECVVQYHPPASKRINLHPHCLHLWRPTAAVVPTPPLICV